jgi:hypothetical protein
MGQPRIFCFIKLLIPLKNFFDRSSHYAESNLLRPVVALPKTPVGVEAIKAARPTLRILSRSTDEDESSVTEGVGGGGGGAEDFLFPPKRNPIVHPFPPADAGRRDYKVLIGGLSTYFRKNPTNCREVV